MEKTNKFIKNFIFFIILIGLTFYILFKDQDIDEIFRILANVNKWYVLLAIFSVAGYVVCEALNAKRNLIALEEKTTLMKCIKYTLANAFFSGITPSSTGGQPMEVYYMHRDGIKISNATLIVLVQSCGFQIATLSFALISIFFNLKYMNAPLLVLFIIGFILNAFILTVYLVSIFSRRISKWAIQLFVKILRKLKVKNIEQRIEKINNGLEAYQNSAKYIKANKKVIFKTLLTTAFQIFFYYSITYMVYCSFGFKEYNILQIIGMQAVVYTSTSGIPLPGAVGISEGNFMSLFKNIFINNTVTSAMLLSRGVSFYLLVIVSGIMVLVNMLHLSKKQEFKEKHEEE